MWIWGGTTRGKFGTSTIIKDQTTPLKVEFEVVEKEINDEGDKEIYLEMFLDENVKHKKFHTEYIS